MFRRKHNQEVQLISIVPRGTQYGDSPKAQGKSAAGSEVIWTKGSESFVGGSSLDNSKQTVASKSNQHKKYRQHALDAPVLKRESKERVVLARRSKSLDDNLDKIDQIVVSSYDERKKKHGSQPNDLDKQEPVKTHVVKKQMKVSPSTSPSPSPSPGSAGPKSNPKVKLKAVTLLESTQSSSSSQLRDGDGKSSVSSSTTVVQVVRQRSPSPRPNLRIVPQMEPKKKGEENSKPHNLPSPAGQARPRVYSSNVPNVQIIPLMEPKKASDDKGVDLQGIDHKAKLSSPANQHRNPSPPPFRSRSPNLQIVPLMEPKQRTSDQTTPTAASPAKTPAKKKEHRHSSGAILESSWTPSELQQEEQDDDLTYNTKSLKPKHHSKVYVHKSLVETKSAPFKATKSSSVEQESFRDRTDTTESKMFNVSFDL